jgi:hypothetical protein
MKRFTAMLLGLCLCASASWSLNKAGLVIKNSTGELITRCVEFEEEFVTVEKLLVDSGFKLITENFEWGAMVHYIHDDGVMDGSLHPDGWLWNFLLKDANGWIAATADVSSVTVVDGTIFGFGFGALGEVELPERSFTDVCEIISMAGVIVDHSDGSRVVNVVEFPGETITGLQLLEKTGLELTTNVSSFGTAVCAIDNEGQPGDNCFGDPQWRYWAFNTLGLDNQWISSMVGAGDAIVRNNDIHGYFFSVWGSVEPPVKKEDILGVTSGLGNWEDYQ